MGLLTPDPGTLFWMVIIFGIVFFILAKYAFPVITGMVDKRKQYIDSSLEAARQANEQLQQVKAESEALLARAHEEQTAILKEASATRDRIIAEARERARTEARKALDETRHQIAAEKESAINDIRRQVAILSVDVAEKVLRKKLSDDKEQLELVNRLLDEVKSNNNIELLQDVMPVHCCSSHARTDTKPWCTNRPNNSCSNTTSFRSSAIR